MSETKTKGASRPRLGDVSFVVGDVVCWGRAPAFGVVEAIQVIDSGVRIPGFCGNGDEAFVMAITVKD